ncbi:MAG: DUF4358 domain-containing protein [Ruminococcus sp.]|nr:DUF4358 domain-containing protein [Ruminococcus sp.]
MRIKAVISALLLSACLAGCGEAASSGSGAVSQAETTAQAPEINASTVSEAVETIRAAYPEMFTAVSSSGEELFDQNAEKLFGCKPEELEYGAIAYNASGSTADEVSILILGDEDGDKALALLTERKDVRRADFEDYKPSEVGKIDKALVFKLNKGAALIISDDAESIREMLSQKLS